MRAARSAPQADPFQFAFSQLAVGEGFEPPRPKKDPPVFETGPFVRSGIPPGTETG